MIRIRRASTQSRQTLCNPIDCRLPGSSVHGIFQARILEQVAISYSRESSRPRYPTHISWVSCIGRKFFTTALPGETCLSVCYLSEDAKLRMSFSITWAALSLDCLSLDLSLVDKSLLYQGLYLVKLFCCYLLAYQEIGFIIDIFFISFVFASFLSNLKLNREEKIVPAVLFMKQ